MFWSTLATTAILAHRAAAQAANGGDFIRFGCSQLVVERADPLVTPGMAPSPHMHQIVGGNSFNITMSPKSLDPVTDSSCTSCTFSEDFSNYWTASVYFKSPENGSYKRVPQMANGRLDGGKLEQDGGLTVYYMRAFSGTNKKTTQMKPGFRMMTGDPSLRKKGKVTGICHRCMGNGEGGAPCDSRDTSEFPAKICPNGIRATIIFPSCWDGVNLDSPDHMSHVTYSGGTGLAGDKCPSTHPVRIPQVMYEIMYDTKQFNKAEYFKNGKQPFVYSFGDATGHGQHGDYLFGWKDNALQRGMDALGTNQCASESCPALKSQPGKDAIACTKPQQVPEDVGNGWLTELPGGAAVTYA
ncbi:hypothetical protein P154DRAFT_493178 [Amniculicola lignicola CBS 123094]|uniref:DUF1996 domain-containing protein n=1 Tax=Amniculicola lignicola CBS 123094 TaxID=1392246 RepID=A0A6A5WDN9_9PLEO|nr:hypothetical protein P154DRAFT_493178 [Amniculicola lignicola CBS 123094]